MYLLLTALCFGGIESLSVVHKFQDGNYLNLQGDTTTTTTVMVSFANGASEDKEVVRANAIKFINNTMPQSDLFNEIDGPLLEERVDDALSALEFSWTQRLSEKEWQRYVVPYAEVNEPRVGWSPVFREKFKTFLNWQHVDHTVVSDKTVKFWLMVDDINQKVFASDGPFEESWTFNGGSTPLLMDPLSVVDNTGGSCTGNSIMLVAALRTRGVAARLVFTTWTDEGNHTWVEVFNPYSQEWKIVEPYIDDSGKKIMEDASTINQPCNHWDFCNLEKMKNATRIYASQWDGNTYVELAWAPQYAGAKGIDRTKTYYNPTPNSGEDLGWCNCDEPSTPNPPDSGS